jgi:8-oxo-dGTP diphosphatase
MESGKKFFIAVKGLLFYKEHFLIIQRTNMARGDHYFWEFPGGRLEFGESPEQALTREIFEETGLNVECICPINVWSFFKNEDTEVVGITYLCKSKDNIIKLSNEHGNYAWILCEDIQNYNVLPGILDEIRKLDWEQIKVKLNN